MTERARESDPLWAVLAARFPALGLSLEPREGAGAEDAHNSAIMVPSVPSIQGTEGTKGTAPSGREPGSGVGAAGSGPVPSLSPMVRGQRVPRPPFGTVRSVPSRLTAGRARRLSPLSPVQRGQRGITRRIVRGPCGAASAARICPLKPQPGRGRRGDTYT
jgi:hypothetical protein